MCHVRRRNAALKKSQKTAKAAASCKTAWTALQNGKRPYERRPNGRKKFHFSSCITNKHSILRTLHSTARKRCYYDFFIILRILNVTITLRSVVNGSSMLHMIFVFTSKHVYKMCIYKSIILAEMCLRKFSSLQRLHVLCTSNSELRR